MEKKTPEELQICVESNLWKARNAVVQLKYAGLQKTISVNQKKFDYSGLSQSYFETVGGNWKTTRFFVDLYALESIGFRIGGLAKRWKFVEFSLLDFDFGYAHHIANQLDNRHHDNLRIDWEPIVRGYLPISRQNRCWSLFVGIGAAINVVEMEVPDIKFNFLNTHSVLLEIGAEYKWKKNDNWSSRIFYRYDGCSSIGISFDLYKWSPKWPDQKREGQAH